MVAHKDREQVHAETIPAWRQWLATTTTADGVWLVSWKSATGKSRISYEESVVEALAVGWVDGRTSRSTTSAACCGSPAQAHQRLVAAEQGADRPARARGPMLPAGRRRSRWRRPTGLGLLDDFDNLVVPDDLALAFALYPGARAMGRVPPSARRAILGWIALAKTAPTRAKRINETAERASRGNGRTMAASVTPVLGAAASAVLPLLMGPVREGTVLGVFSRAVIVGLHTESGPRVVSLLARGAAAVPNGVRLAGAG